MKLKLLYLSVLIFCMSAYASSEECVKPIKQAAGCNISHGKGVTRVEKVLSGRDHTEIPLLSILLFQI